MAERPLGLQLLDEPLEREVLVGVRLDRRLAHAAEKVPKRRIPGEVSAEHERVDEESDQSFYLALVAARDRESPTRMSSCPEWRMRRTWNAARRVMKRVAPSRCPSDRIASATGFGMETLSSAPRKVCIEGRRRPQKSSRTGGAPASCFFQYESCSSRTLPRSQAACQSAKSAY